MGASVLGGRPPPPILMKLIETANVRVPELSVNEKQCTIGWLGLTRGGKQKGPTSCGGSAEAGCLKSVCTAKPAMLSSSCKVASLVLQMCMYPPGR